MKNLCKRIKKECIKKKIHLQIFILTLKILIFQSMFIWILHFILIFYFFIYHSILIVYYKNYKFFYLLLRHNITPINCHFEIFNNLKQFILIKSVLNSDKSYKKEKDVQREMFKRKRCSKMFKDIQNVQKRKRRSIVIICIN